MNFEKILDATSRCLYQIRNWRAHWRAFWMGSAVMVSGLALSTLRRFNASACGGVQRIRIEGRLSAKVIRTNGRILNLGCISKRVVTTAGVNFLRDDFAGAGSDISTFKYHASGTATGAEAVSDTALGTEVTDNARTAGTQDNSVSKHYKSVGTISYTGAHAITEHGLFSAVSSGTLWDRSVFSAVNVANGESIQFTYDLTISDGG